MPRPELPSREPATRQRLADDLRRAFGIGGGRALDPALIGAEAELIPRLADDGSPVPATAERGPSTLAVLRRAGETDRWVEVLAEQGPPTFRVPGVGTLSFEPGGQLELSSRPFRTVGALASALERTLAHLGEVARAEGVVLLASGIDPWNPVERVALQLPRERYTRMTSYFAARGEMGLRMMRQTASFQMNLDAGAEPLLLWRVLNAAAPALTAIFANSPVYERRDTGHRSYRAHVWRELDATRTGVLGAADDPVSEYLEFALRAPWMLQPGAGTDPPTFGHVVRTGEPSLDEWRGHLSTLFTEVRPKRHFEVRSADAVAPEWVAAPLVLLAGLTGHRPTLHAARDLLGPPDDALLRQAGERGLALPSLARTAVELVAMALAGAEALGERYIGGAALERARAFFTRYTLRGRSPADDVVPGSGPRVRE